MRRIIAGLMPWLKWPMHVVSFALGFVHHLAAFFAWAWVALHVAVPLAGAAFQARFIQNEGVNFFGNAGVHWRGLLALALLPAILVSFRSAYQSARKLRRHGHIAQAPVPLMELMASPSRLGMFVAQTAHHTAGFFGWAWLIVALIGAIGTTGYGLARVWDMGSQYFLDMGGQYWMGLMGLAAIPSVLFASWNTRRSWKALHAWAHERHEARHARQDGAATKHSGLAE